MIAVIAGALAFLIAMPAWFPGGLSKVYGSSLTYWGAFVIASMSSLVAIVALSRYRGYSTVGGFASWIVVVLSGALMTWACYLWV